MKGTVMERMMRMIRMMVSNLLPWYQTCRSSKMQNIQELYIFKQILMSMLLLTESHT